MGRTVVNEHFVPEDGSTLEDYFARREKTPVHHLVRYRWAEEVIAELGIGGPVLDVACGAGYGSYGIAKRFPELEVIGGDYDRDSVAFARDKYKAANLRFEEVDLTRIGDSLRGLEFGCVVSFDTIEHIEHREIMMQNVVERLRPDGVLLLSTPVRSAITLSPAWEHHRIEYSRRALYDFLRRYFGEILAWDFGTMPCDHVFEPINRDEIFYAHKLNPVLCRQPIRVEWGR